MVDVTASGKDGYIAEGGIESARYPDSSLTVALTLPSLRSSADETVILVILLL